MSTHPKIKPAADTTLILGPLDSEGYVDYVAEVTARLQAGVTPENNAAVLYALAAGPNHSESPWDPAERSAYCASLGIPVPPESGDYLLRLEAYLTQELQAANQAPHELWEQVWPAMQQGDSAARRPWSSQEFPRIAAWLAKNEAPLKLIAEGSKRPKYYVPRETGSGVAALLPASGGFGPLITAREALLTRAMLGLGEGAGEEAWQDLQACHRLGRHYAQGPTLVERSWGGNTDFQASRADIVLAQTASLSAAQAKQFQADLASLPPLGKSSESYAYGERCFVLNILQRLARHGLAACKEIELTPDGALFFYQFAASLGIDWNEVLRVVNRWCDRAVAASRQPLFEARIKELDQVNAELAKLVEEAKQLETIPKVLLAKQPALEASRYVGHLLLKDFDLLRGSLDAETGFEVQLELARTALALSAYRTEQGRFPAGLHGLSPRYIQELPLDAFSGKPFHYQAQAGGYLLYSVGPNQKENGEPPAENPMARDYRVVCLPR